MTPLKAQGPSRTCNERKEEEEKIYPTRVAASASASAYKVSTGASKSLYQHVREPLCFPKKIDMIYPTRVAASASASAAVNPVATNGTCKESRLHVGGERCVVSG